MNLNDLLKCPLVKIDSNVNLVQKIITPGQDLILKKYKGFVRFWKNFILQCFSRIPPRWKVYYKHRQEAELIGCDLLNEQGFIVPKTITYDLEKGLTVQTFLKGLTLDKVAWLAETKPQVKSFFRKAGSTLAEVHSLGWIIGDHKPSNRLSTGGFIDLEQFQSYKKSPKLRFLFMPMGNIGPLKLDSRSFDLFDFMLYLGSGLVDKGTTNPETYALLGDNFLRGYLEAGGDPKVIKSTLYHIELLPLIATKVCFKGIGLLNRYSNGLSY